MIKQKSNLIFGLIVSLAAIFAVGFFTMNTASAVTEEELRATTETLQDQINANEEYLQGVESRAQTLENKLADLNVEISNANDKIELSELTIESLQAELEKTIEELNNQKDILRTSIRTLYIEGDVSTVELLLGADNFGEFFDQQEYLERLRVAIKESADQVEALKQEIEDEKTKEEELLADLERQKTVLKEKRSEQQTLLNQTKGEEAAYQNVLADLQNQLQEAQKELEAFLAAQNFVSLGFVNTGEIIGYVGSTGFSTGPHLHYAVYDNGQFVDPYPGGMSYGMTWPLPTVSTSAISQVYGCVAPFWWYVTKCENGKSLHAGLDVSAWYGEPIAAAGSGDIVFRGWLGGYGNAVIIDHGGGIQTYYAHMLD